MKINLTATIDPASPVPAGTAQLLIEQAAIQVASGATTGKLEKTTGTGKEKKVIGTCEFTVSDK